MCLSNQPSVVKKILEEEKDVIIAYKVLKKVKDRLYAPMQVGFVYKRGVNKSNSNRKRHCRKYTDITRGIHVFRNLEAAQDFKESDEVVVKVRACKANLIGANDEQMVFTEINITRIEYAKALGTYKSGAKEWLAKGTLGSGQ